MRALEHRYANIPPGEGLQHVVEVLLRCIQQLPGKLRRAAEFVYQQGLGMRAASGVGGGDQKAGAAPPQSTPGARTPRSSSNAGT